MSDNEKLISDGINNLASSIIDSGSERQEIVKEINQKIYKSSSQSSEFINSKADDIVSDSLVTYLGTTNIENEDAYTIASTIVSEVNRSSVTDSVSSTEGTVNTSTTSVSRSVTGGAKTVSTTSYDSTPSVSHSGTSYDPAADDPVYQVLSQGTGFLRTILGKAKSVTGRLNGNFGTAITSILGILETSITGYQDGITETSFGSRMEASWYEGENSFLNYFSTGKGKAYKIQVSTSTPLEAGTGKSVGNLYGTLLLGAPYSFGKLADPDNRTLLNSFLKDGRFLSLTPGLPKYNGGSYTAAKVNSIFEQTPRGDDMLAYLLKNGVDKSFAEKDKRYYTFQANYKEYFAYLESMLIPIWLKLGLGTDKEDGEKFNIFSFFELSHNNETDGVDGSRYKDLKKQYFKPLSFFVNATSSVSESISSQMTSFGGELSGEVNSASAEYQKLNYLSGMGTGGSVGKARSIAGNIYQGGRQVKDFLGKSFENTVNGVKDGSGIAGKLLGLGKGLVADILEFNSTKDLSAVIQSFATQNGMQVVYPELWADSSYNKNINFNITFTSPYGDPLSIFQYVYVPFCALLCFALPRQADSNGFISPFFVRADIPGLISSDLALITDLTWTRGGDADLWTKDGLPRSISCTLTISDLYPYLAMTKRYSFLSANPSYTVFLDSLAGLHALSYGKDDPMNTYWDRMIQRISGPDKSNGGTNTSGLWNKFNATRQALNKKFINSGKGTNVGKTTDINSIPWLRQV